MGLGSCFEPLDLGLGYGVLGLGSCFGPLDLGQGHRGAVARGLGSWLGPRVLWFGSRLLAWSGGPSSVTWHGGPVGVRDILGVPCRDPLPTEAFVSGCCCPLLRPGRAPRQPSSPHGLPPPPRVPAHRWDTGEGGSPASQTSATPAAAPCLRQPRPAPLIWVILVDFL